MKLKYLNFIFLVTCINSFAQKDSSGIFEKILSDGSSKTWHAPVFQKYFTFKLKPKNAEWMATRGRQIRSRKFSKWSIKKQADSSYVLSFPKSENYLISFQKKEDYSWILVLKNKPPSPTKYIVNGEYFEK
jgi:hypothetical protein